MLRCPLLRMIVETWIYEVATAMLDGSWWKEDHANAAWDSARDVSSPAYWD